ncbi:ABC transporter permease, partial [Lactobacillus sp. XV13L]|nr:ABC transporter permease [Lactobacillus sp. XV13L]
MHTRLYIKTTFKDIYHSWGRFLAITIIIFLGVLLFVGIKSIGPNLELTINEYVRSHQLSDLQVVSSAGLTTADQKLAQKIIGAQVELGHSWTYHDTKHDQNLQVYSYQAQNQQNQLTLRQGRYPKKSSEALINVKLKKFYPLNKTLQINNRQLRRQRYRIVGYINSPLYVDQQDYDSAQGQLDGYVYLPATNFLSQTYSIMYLRFKDLNDLS